jgi:hypothetical protein
MPAFGGEDVLVPPTLAQGLADNASAWSVRLLWVVSRTVYSIWPVWPLAKSQIHILVIYQRSHLLELTYLQTRH